MSYTYHRLPTFSMILHVYVEEFCYRYKQYRSLLAAEVVLLMCYVPSFAEYLQKEPGKSKMILRLI